MLERQEWYIDHLKQVIFVMRNFIFEGAKEFFWCERIFRANEYIFKFGGNEIIFVRTKYISRMYVFHVPWPAPYNMDVLSNINFVQFSLLMKIKRETQLFH